AAAECTPRRHAAKETTDSRQESSALRSQGQSRLRSSVFFQGQQGAAILDTIAQHGDGDVVAAVFPLVANLVRQPPDRRVVEENRLDQRLQQVDEVVVSANVGKLVRYNGFQLRRRKPGDD